MCPNKEIVVLTFDGKKEEEKELRDRCERKKEMEYLFNLCFFSNYGINVLFIY